MRLRSASRRHLGPWMEGPPHAVHAVHADTLELCVVLSGSSHLALDDTVHVLGEGDVVIITPGVVHSSWTEGSSAEELVLHLLAAGQVQTLRPCERGRHAIGL